MAIYLPYIPQAIALLAWSACMLLTLLGKLDLWGSFWMMIGGGAAMGLACLVAGNVELAIVCFAASICFQDIPLLFDDELTEANGTCLRILSQGMQVIFTMSQMVRLTYSKQFTPLDTIVYLLGFAAFVMPVWIFRRPIGSTLTCGGVWTLAVGAFVTFYAMARCWKLDNVAIISLLSTDGSLVEAAVAACALALSACAWLYDAQPSDDRLSALALPATMVATSFCMGFLGESGAGIALSIAMAARAVSAGRKPAPVIVALVLSIAVAAALWTVAPRAYFSRLLWAGAQDGSLAGTDRNSVMALMFSGDSLLLGYGVGRAVEALYNAEFIYAQTVFWVIGTFGLFGLATIALVAGCSLVAAVRALCSEEGGKAIPFMTLSMVVSLLLELANLWVVLPFLTYYAPAFPASFNGTSCFRVYAIILAVACDVFVCQEQKQRDE